MMNIRGWGVLKVFGDESRVGDLSWYGRDHEGPGDL